jgi:hypothetical protein
MTDLIGTTFYPCMEQIYRLARFLQRCTFQEAKLPVGGWVTEKISYLFD